MDVHTLMRRMEQGERLTVIDVREPGETEIIAMPFAKNIPLQELPHRVSEIPKDEPVVLHCKSGFRSAKAWHELRKAGYEHVYNLVGGILAYQKVVEPDAPRY